jgi:hypothetical protein
LIEENILIIGSGNRVRRNFLPALFCLKKIYNINILGVFSRNFLNAKKASEEWGLNPLSSEIDLLKLDLTIVIVSITNSNLLSILLKLEKYKKKIKIIIDTPAFCHLRDLPLIKRISKKHDIYVAEDYIYFPLFNLFRAINLSGVLGKLMQINLVNNGYFYHGTALLRSFINFSPFLSIIRSGKANKVFDSKNNNKYYYKFNNSLKASITYPYNPEAGYIELIAENGVVTTKKVSEETCINKNIYRVDSFFKNQVLFGYKVKIKNLDFESDSEFIPILLASQLSDKTDFNLHKTCGTINFLKSIISSEERDMKYDLFQGIYDSILSKKKFINLPYFFDPTTFFGKNFLNLFWGNKKDIN